VSLRRWFVWPGWVRILLIGFLSTGLRVGAQDAPERKIKSQIPPAYPDLARRMGISGAVKVLVHIDKGGNVKDAKVVGGHPVLANAALDAVRKWKYQPGTEETVGIVEFHFSPNQ